MKCLQKTILKTSEKNNKVRRSMNFMQRNYEIEKYSKSR
ncbi:MAG: hypothetical protein RHS_5667 [Robinsoniella sp. RHS]|nr:MAG: hypothetical protein RHS_5667 [Robinsoniella sp. RHS]